jgi:hypothetical protein
MSAFVVKGTHTDRKRLEQTEWISNVHAKLAFGLTAELKVNLAVVKLVCQLEILLALNRNSAVEVHSVVAKASEKHDLRVVWLIFNCFTLSLNC